jgi:hypothetical protein
MNNTIVHQLVVPIELGPDNTIESITLHKPTLGELTKVRSTDNFQRGMEMLIACSDQPKIVLQRLSYDDTIALMEVLPDFLGIAEEGTD